MKFPLPLRAPLALLIAYVVVASAAPPLNAPPESSFSVASPPGSRPTSSGGSVIYNSTHAANLDDPGAFAVHTPDDSTGVTHDPNLPTPYSFTRFGAKDDSIEPPNLFTYIGADDTPKGLHATVEGVSKVKLSGGRVVPRHLPFRSNDPKFPRCEHWQKLLILDAIDNAKRILIRAVRDIDWAIAANHVARTNFVTWFGRYSRDNANQVRRNLVGFGRDLDFWRYDIKCGYPNTVPSEIFPDQRKIRISEPFWRLMGWGRPVQLLRMAAKRNTAISYEEYGSDEAHAMAMQNPGFAIWNLDNYVAFIWQHTPSLAHPSPPDHPHGPHYPPAHPQGHHYPPYHG